MRARPASFEEIYETHVEWLWHNLRRLGVNDASVDDAVQDVFVVVHRRLHEFEGRSSMKTWLFGIALGIARNHRRSARRRMPEAPGGTDETDDVASPESGGPERRAADAEAVRVLYRLLDTLSEEKREALVLSDLEEMSAPEIAVALGLNLNTVYARIRAARIAFEQAVKRHQKEATWQATEAT